MTIISPARVLRRGGLALAAGLLVGMFLGVFLAVPAHAAPAATSPAGRGSAVLGSDVSWPQCGRVLPRGQAFAIVGVNDGLANTTNPCLATELSWAGTSTGGTSQPAVALYVNTANPGPAGSWWPAGNSYGGSAVANPYGSCTGSAGAACAYMYGYAKAYDDANGRGVSEPAAYRWWLDVETSNSWSADQSANRADLEGMTAYFRSIGADVGLYSTGTQWAQIAGTAPAGSNLYNLPSWLAGSRTQSGAQRTCSASALTGGGEVTLTQFVSGGLDYDYPCS